MFDDVEWCLLGLGLLWMTLMLEHWLALDVPTERSWSAPWRRGPKSLTRTFPITLYHTERSMLSKHAFQLQRNTLPPWQISWHIFWRSISSIWQIFWHSIWRYLTLYLAFYLTDIRRPRPSPRPGRRLGPPQVWNFSARALNVRGSFHQAWPSAFAAPGLQPALCLHIPRGSFHQGLWPSAFQHCSLPFACT
jgi:hypothetical protein